MSNPSSSSLSTSIPSHSSTTSSISSSSAATSATSSSTSLTHRSKRALQQADSFLETAHRIVSQSTRHVDLLHVLFARLPILLGELGQQLEMLTKVMEIVHQAKLNIQNTYEQVDARRLEMYNNFENAFIELKKEIIPENIQQALKSSRSFPTGKEAQSQPEPINANLPPLARGMQPLSPILAQTLFDFVDVASVNSVQQQVEVQLDMLVRLAHQWASFYDTIENRLSSLYRVHQALMTRHRDTFENSSRSNSNKVVGDIKDADSDLRSSSVDSIASSSQHHGEMPSMQSGNSTAASSTIATDFDNFPTTEFKEPLAALQAAALQELMQIVSQIRSIHRSLAEAQSVRIGRSSSFGNEASMSRADNTDSPDPSALVTKSGELLQDIQKHGMEIESKVQRMRSIFQSAHGLFLEIESFGLVDVPEALDQLSRTKSTYEFQAQTCFDVIGAGSSLVQVYQMLPENYHRLLHEIERRHQVLDLQGKIIAHLNQQLARMGEREVEKRAEFETSNVGSLPPALFALISEPLPRYYIEPSNFVSSMLRLQQSLESSSEETEVKDDGPEIKEAEVLLQLEL